MAFSRLAFVSYTHEDRERVRPVVELLAHKLRAIDASIFWDQKLRGGAPISEAIHKLLSEAACVVAIWTMNSVSSQWIQGECEAARQDGRLVSVVMEQGAEIRPPFNVLLHILLDPWLGEETPEFTNLWRAVQQLVERGGGAVPIYNTLAQNPYIIQNATEASGELRKLTTTFRSVNEVLIASTPPVQDLRKSLQEVMKTYRVVTDAVQRFTIPALKPGVLDPEPYVALAHGDLPQEIEAGRGHCGRILIHYRRLGGVRDAIEARLTPTQLDEVDRTFDALGTADGDAFQRMTQIGFYLREESRAIINSLFARQHEAARRRIETTRSLLAPLEAELSNGMNEIQQIQASLGGVSAP